MEKPSHIQKPLRVIEGNPFFYCGEKPFFWLGDTAWLLFHKLKFEEIQRYLRNRSEKGFNVIQITLVHYLPALNAYGHNAFIDNSGYWNLVDETVAEANKLGLYLALLPHWGNLQEKFSLTEMKEYIAFLATRYTDKKNIIWVVGGDTRGDSAFDYWTTMGNLLKSMTKDQLITFHPFGRTSSVDFFKDSEWIDFHMFQSGHRRYDQSSLQAWDDSQLHHYGEDNWQYVRDSNTLHTIKPIIDAEPSYEHIPQGLHVKDEPYWNQKQVRRYGWWSVLAGAGGFTYGHNSIMQFYNGQGSGDFFVKIKWQDALHAPASDAVAHMKHIMEPIICDDCVGTLDAPEMKAIFQGETLLTGESQWSSEQKEERILVYGKNQWILAYTYLGKNIVFDREKLVSYAMSQLGTSRVFYDVWWVRPETGVKSFIVSEELTRNISDNTPITFTVPESEEIQKDWLLMIQLQGS